MSFESLTNKHLTNLKERILQQMSVKKLYASGGTAASLEVKGNQLLGKESIYYLVNGRGPGKFPPNLYDWVRQKLGLSGGELKQVDFLIRRKIANEGTEIYKDKTKGIELDKLVSEMLDELTKELPEEAVAEAKTWL